MFKFNNLYFCYIEKQESYFKNEVITYLKKNWILQLFNTLKLIENIISKDTIIIQKVGLKYVTK